MHAKYPSKRNTESDTKFSAAFPKLDFFAAEMQKYTRLPPILPKQMREGLQMVSIPLPICDDELLRSRLYEEYRIVIPITRSGNRMFARISVQGYNTPEDAKSLIKALQTLLPQLI